jgi:ABC-type nitrate/sulfonate/bicarbonate transport system ATPase subunit
LKIEDSTSTYKIEKQIQTIFRHPDRAYQFVIHKVKEALFWNYYCAILREPKVVIEIWEVTVSVSILARMRVPKMVENGFKSVFVYMRSLWIYRSIEVMGPISK